MPVTVLLSIHDVMPDTLDEVLALLEWMRRVPLPPAPLLVSPGLPWTPPQLDVLRQLAAEGHELAGHGWTHRADHIQGPVHHLHALLLSRNAAEHLSQPAPDIEAMLRRCHRWFGENNLPEPRVYVPPAWGMGHLDREAMKRLPFRWYESLTGIYDSARNRFRLLPLVGFEADTKVRRVALGALNTLNAIAARGSGLPLRVAIHPRDRELLMAPAMTRLLKSPLQCVTVRSAVD